MNLREAAQQALEALEIADSWGTWNRGSKAIAALRAALAEDVPETNFGNMAQEVDCYGDGNVYHTNGMPAVEGPLSKAHRISQESRQVEPVAWLHEWDGTALANTVPPNYYGDHWKHTPLYTAPPKREPLTNREIFREYATLWQFLQSEDHLLAQDILKFARAIERAHGIGGEE